MGSAPTRASIWSITSTAWSTSRCKPDGPPDMATSAGAVFDYIIVGAGSAGSVLAARLTEDARVRVLLLEAGPTDRSWRIHMPSGMGGLLSSERFNWAYISE